MTNGRNNVRKVLPVIFQHAVPRRAFDQVAGCNGATDNAFIQMFGVRDNIKIHDPGKGDHEKDDEKDVKPEAQLLKRMAGRIFLVRISRAVSLISSFSETEKMAKVFQREMVHVHLLPYYFLGINGETVPIGEPSG